MSALGVPAALLLGLVAELAGGLVLHLAGRARPWHSPATRLWADGRELVRRRDRATGLELGGTAAALTGAGLAGAAGLGFLTGSAALVYPALVLAVAGGHVAASVAPWGPHREMVVRARRDALLAEPAFLLALGASFLRWGAFDLEAVRGSQQVLGPGVAVGPPAVAIGLVLAVVVALAAAVLRLPPAGEGGGSRDGSAGSLVALSLSRWAAAGATAMVVAVPVAGGTSFDAGALNPVGLWSWAAGAAVAAMALGAGGAMLTLLSPRVSGAAVGMAALVLAAGATVLVMLG